jgi:molybdenum cofactor biosynthesis enzyme
MCKSMDRGMRLSEVELMHKSGGKSGDYAHPEAGALNAPP